MLNKIELKGHQGCQDTHHNNIQHNNIQHNATQHNKFIKMALSIMAQNTTWLYCCIFLKIMLSVVMLSDVILSHFA